MAYGWTEHVGELELWVEAPTREAVFADALRAIGEVIGGEEQPGEKGGSGETALTGDGERHGTPEPREIALGGDDLAVLLADWLAELAFLAETEGFVPAAVERLELAPGGLRAAVTGHRGAPPHLVKAVTYHRLAFEPSGGGWRAIAVLDV